MELLQHRRASGQRQELPATWPPFEVLPGRRGRLGPKAPTAGGWRLDEATSGEFLKAQSRRRPARLQGRREPGCLKGAMKAATIPLAADRVPTPPAPYVNSKKYSEN
jgi:hypothetical protein